MEGAVQFQGTEKLRFMKSWMGGPETTWLLVLGCKAGGEETQVLTVPVLSSHGGESEHLWIWGLFFLTEAPGSEQEFSWESQSMGHHFCRIFLTLHLSDALCLLSFRQGVANKGVAPENVSDSLYPCIFRCWSLFWHNPQILQILLVILSSTILKVFESPQTDF